jgi:uncharacterized membrane protein
MIVLFVLLISLLLYRAIGALGVAALATWVGATRYALATMLLFTASAHFTKMKNDLVRMMPDWIPQPMALVYFTGVCEIAGAIGLLLPSVRQTAGLALIVFFIVVFPANVKAARSGVGLGGKRPTPLWLRASMQVLFIALTWWSAVRNAG